MHKLFILVAVHVLSSHAVAEEMDPRSVVSVRLERTECFGSCPVYALVASRDGTLFYRGTDHVKARGERVGEITQKDFSQLADAAAQVKFLSFSDHYVSKADGCTEVWTDHPSVKITLRFTSGEKSVEHYMGCKGLAEASRVDWLAKTIDELAQTSQWVGPR